MMVPLRQLCGVAGLPRHVSRVRERLSRDGVPVVAVPGAGGLQWHCDSSDLRDDVRRALRAADPGQRDITPSPDADQRWRAASRTERDEAAERWRIARSVQQQLDMGRKLHAAARVVAAQEGCSPNTVKNIWSRVADLPEADWHAALLKAKRGPTPAEDKPEAQAFFAAFCREMQAGAATRTLQDAHCAVARQLGQVLSYRQTRRRWLALDAVTRRAIRRGLADAVDALTPYVAREKPATAMEVVSLDARRADVMVLFPGDSKPVRPSVVLTIDWHSGKRLGWRIAKEEDRETIRSLILDIEREYGLPDMLQADNGRANESLSGLSFRGKRRQVVEELATFFLSRIGVQAYHAAPYNGRAKPVERTFNEDARAERDGFFGERRAYVGNHPGARAKDATGHVTLAEFEAWYAEHCARKNAGTDRRGTGMADRSCDQAFADGLAARAAPPRRLSPAQRRLARFDGETRTPDPKTGAIRINHATFEAPDAAMRARLVNAGKVLVFFDPADLNADVTVTGLEGRMICEALPVKARSPFRDREAVKAQQRARRDSKAYVAAQLDAVMRHAASYRIAAPAVAEKAEPPARPAEKVVSPAFGTPIRPAAPDPTRPDNTREALAWLRAERLRKEIG